MIAAIPGSHTRKRRSSAVVYGIGSQCMPSSGRRVSVLLVCCISMAGIRCIRIASAGTLRAAVWTAGETEATTAASGPFRKTRGARSCLAARPSTDDGNFVESSAEDVEDEIVDEQRRPGPNADEA
jgi:hypothetical protein